MKSVKEKYKLYEEYFGICVNENEYNKIIDSGKIPSDLQNLFFEKFHIRGTNYFSGEFAKKLANQEETVFLQDGSGSFCSSPASNTYFFYDDYLIVVPVGEYNYSATRNLGEYKEVSNIKPVIIPLNKIMNIEIKEGTYAHTEKKYNLILTFPYQKKITIELFHGYKNNKLKPSNWSFAVNKILLGLSDSEKDAESNIDILVDTIEELIDDSLDYEKITHALAQNFNSCCISELDSSKYNKELFSKNVIKNSKNIKDNSVLKEIINKYEKELKDKNNQLKDKNNQLKSLTKEIEVIEGLYSEASFLKKISIKSNINEIKRNIKDLKNDIDELKDETEYLQDSTEEYLRKNIYDLLIGTLETTDNENTEIDQSAIKFYKTCKSKKINNPKEKEQRQIFEMLYMKENIQTYEEALKIYDKGKNCIELEKKQEIDFAKLGNKTKLITQYNVEKDLAQIVGFDKYLPTALEEAIEAKNMAKASNLLGQLASLQSQTKPTKLDSAIMGGLANGIAGPAAGIMTARNVQSDNLKSEQEAKHIREVGKVAKETAGQFESSYRLRGMGLNRKIESLTNRMCDVNNKEKYFKYLDYEIEAYRFLEENIIDIKLNIKLKEDIVINNIGFILDGSLKINILENNKKIGDAYVNAPGYDNMNIEEVGFKNKNSYTAIGIVDDIKSIENIKFEIEPHNLWIIEK